jgi:hypothetical protein
MHTRFNRETLMKLKSPTTFVILSLCAPTTACDEVMDESAASETSTFTTAPDADTVAADDPDEAPTEEEQNLAADPGVEDRSDDVLIMSPSLFESYVEFASLAGKERRQISFLEYIYETKPSLGDEASLVISGLRKNRANCTCSVAATINANPDKTHFESFDGGSRFGWSHSANGAAHYGFIRRDENSAISQHQRQRENFTEVSLSIICLDAQNQLCQGASCSGAMHVYSEYGAKLYGWAETKEIWNKAAQASVSDGAQLSYQPPGASEIILFNKSGSVTRYSNKTAFNVAEAVNVVVSVLKIATAVSVFDIDKNGDLFSKIVASLARVISREGANGSTDAQMFVAYDSRPKSPFLISYVPWATPQVHKGAAPFGRRAA